MRCKRTLIPLFSVLTRVCESHLNITTGHFFYPLENHESMNYNVIVDNMHHRRVNVEAAEQLRQQKGKAEGDL